MVSEISEDISYKSTQHILGNLLGMKRVNARLASKYLNILPNGLRIDVAKDMFDNVVENPTFTKRAITSGETWNYEKDVETVLYISI